MLAEHLVFKQFAPFRGHAAAGYDVNFVGARTDVEFLRGFGWASPDRMVDRDFEAPYPPIGEETFEWQIMLEAILAAQHSFTMIELGAGFGRWLSSAACAVRSRRPELKLRLVGVEAQADHFRWMDKHLRDNDLDPADHKLIEGAVAVHPGSAFLVDGPDPSGWWGQYVTSDSREIADYIPGSASRPVALVTLPDIMRDEGLVDLIDMDIQNAEKEVVPTNLRLLTRRVRRIYIETHQPDTHVICDSALRRAGWTILHSYPQNAQISTEFGPITMPGGGVITAFNPSIDRPKWRRLLGF
jgi:FkbM family methyltransferase